MKKSLFISLVLLSGVLLTACGKDDENVENLENVEITECQKAVNKYLEGSDKEGTGEEVKAGDNIVVDYIGRLEDGTVFDTSIESIAKACGKYRTGADYTQGLSFEAQGGQMVNGFDNGVIGMKVGQTRTVQFGPEEGYGKYDKELVVTYAASDIGDLSLYNVGDYFQPNPYVLGRITSITDKEMVVDFNHELAGKNLIFDITLKNNFGSETASNIGASSLE